MSRLTRYVFRSVWWVEAPLDDVCAVLGDLRTYPLWWPEIRTVEDLGDGRFQMVARSFLPYELRFVSEGRVHNHNRRVGVIEASLSANWRATRAGRQRPSPRAVGSSTTKRSIPARCCSTHSLPSPGSPSERTTFL